MAFDANLSNADTDLAELEWQVAATGPAALSFIFSGLPGTGKSAFARHLATRLGLEVLEKRGSDLLGMFVGETEKRIADAFPQLTPGDFAIVARKAKVLGINDPIALASLLEVEVLAKPSTSRRIGF